MLNHGFYLAFFLAHLQITKQRKKTSYDASFLRVHKLFGLHDVVWIDLLYVNSL